MKRILDKFYTGPNEVRGLWIQEPINVTDTVFACFMSDLFLKIDEKLKSDSEESQKIKYLERSNILSRFNIVDGDSIFDNTYAYLEDFVGDNLKEDSFRPIYCTEKYSYYIDYIKDELDKGGETLINKLEKMRSDSIDVIKYCFKKLQKVIESADYVRSGYMFKIELKEEIMRTYPIYSHPDLKRFTAEQFLEIFWIDLKKKYNTSNTPEEIHNDHLKEVLISITQRYAHLLK